MRVIEVGINTYISVIDADDILGYELQDYWRNATTEEKERALVSAFEKIESKDYIGTTPYGQTTKFPRSFQEEVPVEVKKAQAYEAFEILKIYKTNQNYIDDASKGVESRSIGQASVKYNAEHQNKLRGFDFVSAKAKAYLKNYINIVFERR